MNRKVFDNMKVIQNVASTTFKDKQINFGHSVGPGGRAFMYVSQAKQDDDEEENFQDVDRVLEEQKTAVKKEHREISKKINASQYDPHKREP